MKATAHPLLLAGAAVAALVVGLLATPSPASSGTGEGVAERPPGDSNTANDGRRPRNPLVSVAGDIACGPNVHAYNGGNGTATQCRQKYTSRLILGSDAVWTLGDHAYPNATLENLRIAYSPTWGRKKRVTYPTPGDHDYDNARRAYHQYFGTRPYYTFTMGGWRVFSLNSEINHSRSSAQVRWLRRKLSSSRADCIAAYWSVPRWSSGSERGDASFRPFVRSLVKRRADLMLGGDTHNYERFARQTATGARRARGIRQFVVGTGGRSLDGFSEVHRNSQVRRKAFGVLNLTLRDHSYRWRFVNQARRTLDAGRTRCN
jgi:hypothetical protein